jgi:hypothetical protein
MTEKLFLHIDTFVYLSLPILFILLDAKKKDGYVLALYGLVFFLLLFTFDYIPVNLNKLYNTCYTFLEYSFFAFLFYFNFTSPKKKKLVIIFSFVFYFVQVIHFFFIVSTRLDSIAIGVESILILLFIILFFLESLVKPEAGYIYTHHFFWISTGLLIFLSGTFFINILAESLPRTELDKYWFVNYLIDTVKTVFFAIALFLYSRKIKNSTTLNKPKVPYLDMV